MIIPFHALPISREETDFKLNEDEFRLVVSGIGINAVMINPLVQFRFFTQVSTKQF